MNKIVKILLLILAVLLIAGGGFWSGTQVAYRQTAALPTQPSTANASPNSIAPRSPDSNQPDWNPQWNGNNTDPRGRFSGDSSNSGADQKNFKNRQEGWFTRPDFQTQPAAGLMMNQRFNAGFRDLSIGGLFMAGGMMIFGLLFPLGFAVLMVLGIIVLYRMVRKPSVSSVVGTSVCAKCGGSIQNDWKHCPHCGESI